MRASYIRFCNLYNYNCFPFLFVSMEITFPKVFPI